MKDFQSHYPSSTGKRQKITRRETVGAHPHERKWFWRITGTVVFLALTVGMVASLWFGYRINSSLAELATQQEQLEQATATNQLLQQQQEKLLSEERVLEAVRDRGLNPPTAAQIKRM
jgi:cell division protein FtsL